MVNGHRKGCGMDRNSLRVIRPPHRPLHPFLHRLFIKSIQPFFPLFSGILWQTFLLKILDSPGSIMRCPSTILEISAPNSLTPIFLLTFSPNSHTFQLATLLSHRQSLWRNDMSEINSSKFTTTIYIFLLTFLFLTSWCNPSTYMHWIFLDIIAMCIYLVICTFIIHPLKWTIVWYHSKRFLRRLSRVLG